MKYDYKSYEESDEQTMGVWDVGEMDVVIKTNRKPKTGGYAIDRDMMIVDRNMTVDVGMGDRSTMVEKTKRRVWDKFGILQYDGMRDEVQMKGNYKKKDSRQKWMVDDCVGRRRRDVGFGI